MILTSNVKYLQTKAYLKKPQKVLKLTKETKMNNNAKF